MSTMAIQAVAVEKAQTVPDSPQNVVAGTIDDPAFAEWDKLVSTSPHGSVFCTSWWIRALGEDVRLLGYVEDGSLVAGMPYCPVRWLGLQVCTMPWNTPYWGVLIEAPVRGKLVATASREMRILRTFASVAAKQGSFSQAFHPALQNWLPFYWSGFRQTLRFRRRLDDLSNLDRIWSGIDPSTRSEIENARTQKLQVILCNASAITSLRFEDSEYKSWQHTCDTNLLAQLAAAAERRDAGACFGAIDPDGKMHSAAFLVWDANSAFIYAQSSSRGVRTGSAVALLTWEMIRFAAARVRMFDLGDSMTPEAEHFNRSFGGKQVPYHWVIKFPLWLRAGLMLKGLI